MNPRTKARLTNAALVFATLGMWLTVVALVPRAVDQRLDQFTQAAKPSVEAMEARQVADEAINAIEPTPAPQEPQSEAPGEHQQVIRGATITNYQAVPEQTDGDPCTTADGTDICPYPSFGVVANNCLPFGTKVYIADEVYEVHDRMARRYTCDYFDILTTTRIATFTADVVVL
jgi:3D (Asp-Asp-Asp) domain-containing protein